MHIPDGYLSPSTCAAMYVGAIPFWYVAMQRVKRLLHTRFVPLLSLFSAFSFVVMMFNLPLPGGTTGHAVGVGIATIVLGPWAAILSISIALLIQALFFGDGGITALGANCFNMAVIGSLVTYGVYRLVARGSAITAPRRVVAAGLAGYLAINASALCAAIEFGIQPLLFRDAAGAPLYAPYPLSIAIPAMLIGHLTIAGLAELVLTAGVVSYLQRTDPVLLKRTAPTTAALGSTPSDWSPQTMRTLWVALSMLLILTPLGILAVGTAWGEWTSQDFSDPAMRQEIAKATGQPPPKQAPSGLQRLSTIWTAPFPRYAPAVVRSASFGYALSAMIGVGLIVLLCSLAGLGARGRS
ncbi:MAG: cobalt transporter CbiM [Acidobacteriota bacterium]|nr:cobalt transporter CbiM [Acidobacteriota bacterium]